MMGMSNWSSCPPMGVESLFWVLWMTWVALGVIQGLLDRFGDLVRDLCRSLRNAATGAEVDVRHGFGVIGGQLVQVDKFQRHG